MKNKSFIKVFAFLLILAFAAAFFMTLAVESSHDCTGSDCDLCKTVAVCRNILRIFLIVYLLYAAAHAFRTCRVSGNKPAYRFSGLNPVRLKVRLLN